MKHSRLPLVLIAPLLLSACGENMGDRALSGAAVGAAFGAGLGAVAGGNVLPGALVGGVAGGIVGVATSHDLNTH